MSLHGEAVWVDQVLTMIVQQLVKGTGLPADRVFESLAPDESHAEFPPADRFITVRPVRFPLDPGFSGGGREATGFAASLRVSVFARYAADQELRDTRLLRDRNKGILGLLLKVIDSLQDFDPTQATGEHWFREPMRLADNGFDLTPRAVKPNSPWTVLASDWQVKFTIPLSE